MKSSTVGNTDRKKMKKTIARRKDRNKNSYYTCEYLKRAVPRFTKHKATPTVKFSPYLEISCFWYLFCKLRDLQFSMLD
jgi:hypothetical protein